MYKILNKKLLILFIFNINNYNSTKVIKDYTNDIKYIEKDQYEKISNILADNPSAEELRNVEKKLLEIDISKIEKYDYYISNILKLIENSLEYTFGTVGRVDFYRINLKAFIEKFINKSLEDKNYIEITILLKRKISSLCKSICGINFYDFHFMEELIKKIINEQSTIKIEDIECLMKEFVNELEYDEIDNFICNFLDKYDETNQQTDFKKIIELLSISISDSYNNYHSQGIIKNRKLIEKVINLIENLKENSDPSYLISVLDILINKLDSRLDEHDYEILIKKVLKLKDLKKEDLNSIFDKIIEKFLKLQDLKKENYEYSFLSILKELIESHPNKKIDNYIINKLSKGMDVYNISTLISQLINKINKLEIEGDFDSIEYYKNMLNSIINNLSDSSVRTFINIEIINNSIHKFFNYIDKYNLDSYYTFNAIKYLIFALEEETDLTKKKYLEDTIIKVSASEFVKNLTGEDFKNLIEILIGDYIETKKNYTIWIMNNLIKNNINQDEHIFYNLSRYMICEFKFNTCNANQKEHLKNILINNLISKVNDENDLILLIKSLINQTLIDNFKEQKNLIEILLKIINQIQIGNKKYDLNNFLKIIKDAKINSEDKKIFLDVITKKQIEENKIEEKQIEHLSNNNNNMELNNNKIEEKQIEQLSNINNNNMELNISSSAFLKLIKKIFKKIKNKIEKMKNKIEKMKKKIIKSKSNKEILLTNENNKIYNQLKKSQEEKIKIK